MILSPGLVRAKIVSTMASVEPMVTTISVSGSRVRPMKRPHFLARAWRKLGAPMVMGYWCGPWWLTSSRRSSMALGGSKSGKPWARLMAPHSREIRVIRRITESVKSLFFLLISCIIIGPFKGYSSFFLKEKGSKRTLTAKLCFAYDVFDKAPSCWLKGCSNGGASAKGPFHTFHAKRSFT